MFTPPDDLDVNELSTAVRDGWGFGAVSMEYQPIGFGSHHWLAVDAAGSRRFVTVDYLHDDLRFDVLRRAFRAAHRLRHRAALQFVVAPELTVDGSVLRRVGTAYTAAIYPLVDGNALPPGPYPSDALRAEMLGLTAALHRATPWVTDIAGHDDLTFRREGLDAALAELNMPWKGGPFAEQARLLLAEHASDVVRGLATYDRLVGAVRRSATLWVITHGEPHAQNILLTQHGAALIDWDTALIAPPERDLWMLTAPGNAGTEAVTEGGRGLGHYTELTGYAPDVDALTLYRLRWDLDEIAIYVSDFRRPHRDTADARKAWHNLNHYVALADRWGAVLDP